MTALTSADERALRMLATCNALVGPGYFGTLLWPDTRRPTWAFARPAGKVLNRLKAHGFAQWVTEGSDRRRRWGWEITTAGRRALSQVTP